MMATCNYLFSSARAEQFSDGVMLSRSNSMRQFHGNRCFIMRGVNLNLPRRRDQLLYLSIRALRTNEVMDSVGAGCVNDRTVMASCCAIATPPTAL